MYVIFSHRISAVNEIDKAATAVFLSHSYYSMASEKGKRKITFKCIYTHTATIIIILSYVPCYCRKICKAIRACGEKSI